MKTTKEKIQMLVDVTIEYNEHKDSRKEALAMAHDLGVCAFGGGSGTSYAVKSGRVRLFKDGGAPTKKKVSK